MTPAVVTIGNFDGVHRGHRMLLGQVVDRARVLRCKSYAVTFDPHPQSVLYPSRRVALLTDAKEKEDLIRESGIDEVWTCQFTPQLSRLGPEEFMHVVMERQPIEELWVGADFALGRGRTGTVAVLAEIGSVSGWGLHMVPPYRLEGQVVSSSAIRTLLAAGAVQGAAELLGRPYAVPGQLVYEATQPFFRAAADRALPRPLTYAVTLRSDDVQYDLQATVPPGDGTPRSPSIPLLAPGPMSAGPATLAFARRLSA